ncbi:MAG: hypothetical protein A3G81_12395 [Betaproteobacteria bacterium RIFCSPLOWO2_12_FULL_65_14]|nr:MAG: hypothetical protein A3G81_12395 [Betaproteobacteria bacterium RIFCSPLOWO2_12_FULL_65_14]
MKMIVFGKVLLAAALVFASAVHAQDYPSRPIKIIVPNPPGGGPDVIGRIFADRFLEKWGQPVIVENRAGSGGNIGAEVGFRAAPDGYTLVFTPHPALVINKTLYTKLNYDPDAFVPISVAVGIPVVMVMNPRVPAQNLQQLIAYARANPDRLNYGSGGSGGTPHIAGEYLKAVTGVKMVHVPYKGNAPAVVDLLSGQVDMMMLDLGPVLPHIRGGKLRALGIASEKRNPALPDVPAMNEVLPGFVVTAWFGMVAPPKTPPAIANKISAAMAEILKQPDVLKRLLDMGNIEAIGTTPEEMAQFMRTEREKWGKLIRDIGAKAD